MVAGTLRRAGYFMGTDYIGPRAANPKGFFEGREINDINERLLERVVETRPTYPAKALAKLSFLARPGPMEQLWDRICRDDRPARRCGQLWLGRVPPEREISSITALDGRIRDLVGREPYCFKDPRFCYTLPVWRPHFEDQRTVYVCVFRHPADTIESILKQVRVEPYLSTLAMTPNIASDIWCLMYGRVVESHSRHGTWLFLHCDQLFDAAALGRLGEMVDAPVDYDFPDRRLKRSMGKRGVVNGTTAMYRELCQLARYEE